VLQELKVGEAVLKQKGELPVIVKINKMITPAVSDEAIKAVKDFSNRRYARPKPEVLLEIGERREAMRGSAGAIGFGATNKGNESNGNDDEGQTEW